MTQALLKFLGIVRCVGERPRAQSDFNAEGV